MVILDAKLDEPCLARLEVREGGAQPRLHVGRRTFHLGIDGLVDLVDGLLVQSDAVGPRRLFPVCTTFMAELVQAALSMHAAVES